MVAFETIQFVGGAPPFGPEIQHELAKGYIKVRNAVRFVNRKFGMGILGIRKGNVEADLADHVEGGSFSPRQLFTEHGS